ncbi:MAG: hypothetical protein LBI44_02885 [Oscillospiraceae bacterium]|jgi:flagellar motility protein MotE (MotC chaperone)|nr:hypothetical protein [Oscillospiraceae bacterium]
MAAANETQAKRLSEIDEEVAGKGKKGKKGAPAPTPAPAPADPKAKGGKGGKGAPAAPEAPAPEVRPPRKKHPVLLTLLLTCGFWAALVGAVILVCRLAVYDDGGDVKYLIDPEGVIRGPVLLFLNPQEEYREDYYQREILDIYERERELDDLIAEQEAKIEELDERESALDDREGELDDREATINEWLDFMNQSNAQGAQSSVDITDVAKSVEAMQPAAAASIIANMDTDFAVNVLRAMKAKQRGLLLAAMDPEEAATLMERLVPEEVEPPDSDLPSLSGQ